MFKREKMSLQIVISFWPKSNFFCNEKLLNFMDNSLAYQVFLVPFFENIHLFNSIRIFNGQINYFCWTLLTKVREKSLSIHYSAASLIYPNSA